MAKLKFYNKFNDPASKFADKKYDFYIHFGLGIYFSQNRLCDYI